MIKYYYLFYYKHYASLHSWLAVESRSPDPQVPSGSKRLRPNNIYDFMTFGLSRPEFFLPLQDTGNYRRGRQNFKWFYETSRCPLDRICHADVEGKVKLFTILAWPNCTFECYCMQSQAFVRLLSSGIPHACNKSFQIVTKDFELRSHIKP